MNLQQARPYAALDVVSRGARTLRETMKQRGGHRHGGKVTSVRTAEHKGHWIELLTHYELRVDRRRIDIPLNVDNSGRVTCHAVPNYLSVSAVDVVKRVIDAYPSWFSSQAAAGSHDAHTRAGRQSASGGRRSPRKPAAARKRGKRR